MSTKEELDSQLEAECVGFLDQCFDNSFTLKNSLETLRTLKKDLEDEIEYNNSQSSKTIIRNGFKNNENTTARACSSVIASQECTIQSGQRELRSWGLPDDIVANYGSKGIKLMFDWQVACLSNTKVLLDYANLVYSAPTSAGKTLVAEILAIKTVLERQKKVIVILPFVSVVREKMFYFQQIFSSAGVRVEGFMGSHAPPGGFQAVHIAICTIEKANSLVNRLMDEGNISELGAVVVDEMHLLGDSSRGYILELLLTKIKYMTKKHENIHIQIIGMSATLPNLQLLSNWLEAELYVTDFRPIPLEEYCLIGTNIIDKSLNVVRKIHCTEELGSSNDGILQICLETLKEGCSVLIFCTTKNWCENLAQLIASSFFKLGSSGNASGKLLREQLNSESIIEVLEQLKACPVGLDSVLKTTVAFAVAFHHAGLTFDERDIIEGAFKSGALRILVATSTLSSGVNLPARRVIIRSPVFQKQPINILTYKQMIGRAGRMGKDIKGESILMCTESEKKIGLELMSGTLDSVTSCIEGGDKYMRAILEVIASQVASTKSELELYTNCTLLSHEDNLGDSCKSILSETLICLINFELVRVQEHKDEELYLATPLGKACLSSSMAPNDGLSLFCELQKARQCLVLETDLHLIYLVTPYSVSGQWPNIDWLHLLNLWESLPKAMKRVGELVGVQESFIFRCVRGTIKFSNAQSKVQIHKRFYTALALKDLVNEVPLGEVADKFRCCRGLLQSLQQSAATFAGMVTIFCHQLGWKNIEMLVSQFQDRLHFGIQSELLDLMRLPSLNGLRARSLFNAGCDSVCTLASADVKIVENALYLAIPFQSDKGREGEDKIEAEKRKKAKFIWITGHCGMTVKQAAENLIIEARTYLQLEMGVTEIKWKQHKLESILEESSAIVYEETNVGKTCNLMNDEPKPLHIRNVHKDCSVQSSYNPIENIPSNQINVNTLNCSNSLHDQESKNYIATKRKSTQSTNNSPADANFKTCEEDKSGSNTGELKLLPNEVLWETLDLKGEKSVDKFEPEASESKTIESSHSPSILVSPFNSNFSKHSNEMRTDGVNRLSSITPDASLFSSNDPNSPNLFEESFSVDTQLCKLIDNSLRNRIQNVSRKRKIDCDIFSFNNSTFKDAFQSTFDIENLHDITSSGDDDIKLHYDEEMHLHLPKTTTVNVIPEEKKSTYQEIETSSINTSMPLEMSSRPCINKLSSQEILPEIKCGEPQAKKIKLTTEYFKNIWEYNPKTKLRFVNIPRLIPQTRLRKKSSSKIHTDTHKLTCVFVECEQYLDFLRYLDTMKTAAIFLNVTDRTQSYQSIIGSKIINKFKLLEETESNFKQIQFKNNVLVGVCVCFSKEMCFYLDFLILNLYLNVIFDNINSWLRKDDVCLNLHSFKFNHVYLKQCHIHLNGKTLDTSLMEWLIDSDTIETSVTRQVAKYCERDITLSFETSKNGDTMCFKNKISEQLLTCVKAWGVWNLAEKQINYLHNQYSNVYNVLGLETTIARILSESEICGLCVDKQLASQLLLDVKKSQEVLQEKAYKLYGHRFNLNSSKDVAKALGIYNGHKVSTKKSVLSTYKSPLSNVITYWRKLNVILTRTLYPLTAKAAIESENSRIHASYITHTCTGRVCMHEPNLQNVPRNFTIPASYLTHEAGSIHEDPGDVMEFSCRSIFVASPGWVIVSADYCQLEMRILTHMCADKILMAIMKSDMDVFTSIAASWGGVPEAHVDNELRQRTKQLCYGIIYGMGNKTLAQQLDVTELEAAVFVDSFHRTYPEIKVFTQRVIAECRIKGYVETLKKRRRYLPLISSVKIAEKNSAERQAVNTTIQGSAADIAKAAMCAVDEHVALCGETPNVRLLLQLHDELIYEVLEGKKEFFVDTLRQAMEQAEKLSVPLPVKIKTGYSWGTLADL